MNFVLLALTRFVKSGSSPINTLSGSTTICFKPLNVKSAQIQQCLSIGCDRWFCKSPNG